jgi:CubicO group peptidase (beta-lactamase class C family)
MHKFLRAVVLALLGSTSLESARLRAADDASAIATEVKAFLKDKPSLGLVVGITRPSGRRTYGYGTVTLAGKEQLPAEDTIFEIGSVSKAFTGTLLAELVRSGTVRLDDPVQKYLPADWKVPRRDDRDITLLQLATHTSSLPVQPPLIGFLALTTKDPANPYATFDQARLKQTLKEVKLSRPIGSKFEYSNLGVGLLGHALAQAAKAPNYETLLVERLAQPLGLVDTRLQLSTTQVGRFASGYTKEGKPTSCWTFATLEACGGIRSTAHDLLMLIDAALGRKKTALTESLKMAREPWRETGRRGECVGLCWFQQHGPSGNGTMIWHNGGTGGFRSFLAFVPEKGVGVVVLTNADHPVDALGIAIVKHLEKGE